MRRDQIKRLSSSYGDITVKGSIDEIITKWEGLSYGYERAGDTYMTHIARNHSDHYKRLKCSPTR